MTSIVLVLLPLSVVTYLNFYKTLIPTERIQIPTKLTTNGDLANSKAFVLDASEVLPFIRRNQDLQYLMRLNLNAICKLEKLYQEMEYIFRISDSSDFHDEFLVNCDSRYIYAEKNMFVPYNLRYWVPPILVDIFKLVKTDWPLIYSSGKDLYGLLQNQQPIFTFKDSSALFIDYRRSTIDLVVEWEGIRYYLVNFYITSLIIGAGGFWLLSSWICVVSSLFFQAYFQEEEAGKQKTQKKEI